MRALILHFASLWLIIFFMTILGLASLDGFLKKNATARSPMARWVEITEAATWQDITEIRNVLPTADAIKGTNLTCFNIGGNSYRLLTVISFPRQEVFVHELLTHAQYNKKYVK